LASLEPAARGGDQGLLDAQPFPADQGVVNAVADGSGIGFSLVWLNDKDGNLWMCDADSEVHLFIHHREKRLLEGDGTELVGLQLASGDRREGVRRLSERGRQPGRQHLRRARQRSGFRCVRQDGSGQLYLCNATGDAAVWAFEAVSEPITFDGKPEVT
jgi:hypothetical protein